MSELPEEKKPATNGKKSFVDTFLRPMQGDASWSGVTFIVASMSPYITYLLSFYVTPSLYWVIVLITPAVIITFLFLLWRLIKRTASEPHRNPIRHPAILVLSSLFIVTLLIGFFIGSASVNRNPSQFFDTQLTTVRNRVFTNEEVPLDGYDYISCNFNNVTFVYQGQAPFGFSNNTVKGLHRFKSDSDVVVSTFMLISGLTPSAIRIVDKNNKPYESIKPPIILLPEQNQNY